LKRVLSRKGVWRKKGILVGMGGEFCAGGKKKRRRRRGKEVSELKDEQ